MNNETLVLIERAKRARTAIYLATDASVAEDISAIIDGLLALIPEPPADDEREAVAKVLRRMLEPIGGEPVTNPEWIATAIVSSEPWRNRHRGPITADAVERAAIALYDQAPIRYALTWSEHERAGEVKPWTALGESTRRTYRHRAQLLLEAAEAAR